MDESVATIIFLKGLFHFERPDHGGLVKLTCSTSNSSRSGGGTSYYCITRSNVNFLCSANRKARYRLNCRGSKLIPISCRRYAPFNTRDVAENMGHLRRTNENSWKMHSKAIEEERSTYGVAVCGRQDQWNLYWDGMWREWQDRRHQIRFTMESLQARHEVHIKIWTQALTINCTSRNRV